LIKGDQIQLLVGQQSSYTGFEVGGGGGSFVASGVTPATGVCLVAAGGGAGGVTGLASLTSQNGSPGYASPGYNSIGVDQSNDGNYLAQGGGGAGGNIGGAGAGFKGDATGNVWGGYSFVNGGSGGAANSNYIAIGGIPGIGGFGGGGGCAGCGFGQGGAGGGVAGGGVDARSGGGGSYPTGSTLVSFNVGDGYITITAA